MYVIRVSFVLLSTLNQSKALNNFIIIILKRVIIIVYCNLMRLMLFFVAVLNYPHTHTLESKYLQSSNYAELVILDVRVV